MLYAEYILKAKELTINTLDNGTWYLEPEWMDILYRNDLGDIENLTDSHLTGWRDLKDILKLEVERRNARDSRVKEVTDWIYNIITTTVDPAMLGEETEYLKYIIEKRNSEQAVE